MKEGNRRELWKLENAHKLEKFRDTGCIICYHHFTQHAVHIKLLLQTPPLLLFYCSQSSSPLFVSPPWIFLTAKAVTHQQRLHSLFSPLQTQTCSPLLCECVHACVCACAWKSGEEGADGWWLLSCLSSYLIISEWRRWVWEEEKQKRCKMRDDGTEKERGEEIRCGTVSLFRIPVLMLSVDFGGEPNRGIEFVANGKFWLLCCSQTKYFIYLWNDVCILVQQIKSITDRKLSRKMSHLPKILSLQMVQSQNIICQLSCLLDIGKRNLPMSEICIKKWKGWDNKRGKVLIHSRYTVFIQCFLWPLRVLLHNLTVTRRQCH